MLPWVSAKGTYRLYLRLTNLTWVNRTSGQSVDRAYASHPAGAATDFYTKVFFAEIVYAH